MAKKSVNMAEMDCSSDVPPLEDMSELLKQAESLRESKSRKNTEISGVNGRDTAVEKERNRTEVHGSKRVSDPSKSSLTSDKSSKASNVQESNTFAGFKKGFLLGGSTKSNPSNKPKVSSEVKKASSTVEDIPVIKKKNSESQSVFEMPEVQKAMNDSQNFSSNKEWVTDDLMSKIQKNEMLLKGLQDPRFMQAIGEFQSNPQAAMLKYQNDMEMQNFLKEFCGILGQHFSDLGSGETPTSQKTNKPSVHVSDPSTNADIRVHSSSNPNQPTSADENKMQDILSRPDMREILMDPQIQQLIHSLKNSPDDAQRMFSTASPDMKMKIKKLIDAGLLQFQT